jgi:predicted Zn finger-like uncharacterized protein
MFRVVPDQLRISDGWVRCGKCDEVFDANAHLRALEEAQQNDPVDPSRGRAVDPEPAYGQSPTIDPGGYDWGPVLSPQSNAPTVDIMLDMPELASSPLPSEDLGADPYSAQGLQEPVLDPEPVVASEGALAQAVDQESEDPAPSFLAIPSAPARQSSRAAKMALAGVCAMLLLSLAAQVLISERDRIAATVPALKPPLLAACDVLGCTLSPLQQIDAIAIDSSTFSSVKPGVYLLKVTLKNGATTDLATPALELTLTDTAEQPLLRRVVLPGEFNGALPLTAGGELVASVPVSVQAGVLPQKISGYKLLAFYP